MQQSLGLKAMALPSNKNLGLVDELEIALARVLFGSGRRLFENLLEPKPQFRIDKVLDGPAATHLLGR